MTIPDDKINGKSSNEKASTEDAFPLAQAPPQGSEAEGEALDNFIVTTDDIDGGNEGSDGDIDPSRDPSSLGPMERKLQNWQQSPFAVGCVNVTWADDRRWLRPDSSRTLERNAKVTCSAYVCGCLGAGRLGNLAVLAQTTEQYDHVEIDETGEQRTTKRKRPKLLWVIGPYWPINFFLTYPLIIGVSFLTGWRNLPGKPISVVLTWSLCTFLLLFSLAMIACRNPGVLYRHSQPPPNADDWRWNDQAKTYRPPKARFDPECQAVIEGFDHT